MSLRGGAVLAIWNGIRPEAEAEFVAWHVREHIPERVGLPGFLRGRRYVAVVGHPKYFNFYETETVDALSSPVYLERLDAPTDWTRAVVAHFTDTSRTVCRVRLRGGVGDGAALMTLTLRTAVKGDEFVSSVAAVFDRLAREAGIVGLHLLEGDDTASRQRTAEKALRAQEDAVAAWIILVEAIDPESLSALAPTLLRGLEDAGAIDQDPGIYRLQFDLCADHNASAPNDMEKHV